MPRENVGVLRGGTTTQGSGVSTCQILVPSDDGSRRLSSSVFAVGGCRPIGRKTSRVARDGAAGLRAVRADGCCAQGLVDTSRRSPRQYCPPTHIAIQCSGDVLGGRAQQARHCRQLAPVRMSWIWEAAVILGVSLNPRRPSTAGRVPARGSAHDAGIRVLSVRGSGVEERGRRRG